jgi:prolyl oligopeptidase
MFLAGYGDLETPAARPTIMTAYGGFGLAMTPQFSVFTSVLMERGCLFSLPNIRGGSEFGPTWHEAAKRRSKQTAFTDFLSGAKWLLEKGFTDPGRLAVFGGSNAGLLVAAAITQKPEIFRAALCLLPLTDMLRYHLFDQAWLWIEEFGSARDAEDLAALAGYSPYHQLKNGISYPATLVVSGDADQNCNPMHARKFVARLQAANSSGWPVILDHHPMRGHSPTLPFFQRLESLTDRLAFICDQLGLL